MWPESSGVELSGNTLELDFDESGASIFPLRYRDVGAMRLQASYSGVGEEEGLVMEGAGSFIARPDRFDVAVPGNPESPDVTDTNVFRVAGDPFQIEVQALNALGERTPNFGREVPIEAVALSVAQAAGFSLPNLADLEGELGEFGQSCSDPQGGKGCGEFSWPEVGTFALEPSLSSGAYLGTEDVPGVPVPYVGRFIPAWFDIAIDPGRFSSQPLVSDRTSCTADRGWVYTGEPFGWDMAPEIIVSPKNRTGGAVQNYAGTVFQRLGSNDFVFAEFPAEDDSAVGVDEAPLEAEAVFALPTLAPGTDGDLIYGFALDDEFRYPKTRNARVGAYNPQLVFSLESLIDADGVTILNPVEDLPRAFTPEADFEIRYGRVVLDNAYGPENLELLIPLRAEVFDNGGFRLHEQETCWFYDLPENVTVDFSESALASGQTGVVGVAEAQLNLENGQPLVTSTEDYRLKLSAPSPSGSESPQARGILVELDVGNDWLKDFWDADNPDSLVNPYAWATFGVYRGNDRIIYWREVPAN
jgi:MSHA biogenesis protein MshQ